MGYWVDLQTLRHFRTIISKPFGGYSANSLKGHLYAKREYSNAFPAAQTGLSSHELTNQQQQQQHLQVM